MAATSTRSLLWLCAGVMVLIFAAAGGFVLSGAATAMSAKVGIPEEITSVIAVVTLLVGFAVALGVGLRDLMVLALRDELLLPRRWDIGSILVMFVAGPFWNLCVVHIQEPISGSDSVRTLYDDVLYGLVLTLALPLASGVPCVLARLRRQGRLASVPKL